MHDWLPETGKEWDTEYEKYVRKKWEVILLFTPENQLKDLCYLLKVSDCKNKKGNGGMHLTKGATTYSVLAHGRLPQVIGRVRSPFLDRGAVP